MEKVKAVEIEDLANEASKYSWKKFGISRRISSDGGFELYYGEMRILTGSKRDIKNFLQAYITMQSR